MATRKSQLDWTAVLAEISDRVQTLALNRCESIICDKYEIVFSETLTPVDFSAVPSDVFEPIFNEEIEKAKAEIKDEIADFLSNAFYDAD